MRQILERLCQELEDGHSIVLATIIHQEGSAPRGAGSHMLAGRRGRIEGTIGGGLVEADVIKSCADLCDTGKAKLLSFHMDGNIAANSEMICGGMIDVLLESFIPDSQSAKNIFAVRDSMQKDGCRIVRQLPTGDSLSPIKWIIITDDAKITDSSLTSEAIEMLRDTPDNRIREIEGIRYYSEECLNKERMLIIGGGHVSLSTAKIAELVDFDVYIFDDRAEYANKERFPNAHILVTPRFENCFTSLRITERDYIVIVTRGHLFDNVVAEQALQTSAGYIGMIGSSRKRGQVYKNLLEKGFTKQDLNRIHSPIGLDIGAETPQEIAISIIAECIAHRRCSANLKIQAQK